MYHHFSPLGMPITQKRAGLIGPHAWLLLKPDASLQSCMFCCKVCHITTKFPSVRCWPSWKIFFWQYRESRKNKAKTCNSIPVCCFNHRFPTQVLKLKLRGGMNPFISILESQLSHFSRTWMYSPNTWHVLSLLSVKSPHGFYISLRQNQLDSGRGGLAFLLSSGSHIPSLIGASFFNSLSA